ncbi:hypothetical protein BMETH_1294_0 [methanotrophic bacterial endosymbiont of Bathymodiolus sp.]|nr:hypothetical protein BMETH_1294_0 [methanotrophic bacterial endosymbiont of Bathymodiolus sp.]
MLNPKALREIIRRRRDHLKITRPTLHLGESFGASYVNYDADCV